MADDRDMMDNGRRSFRRRAVRKQKCTKEVPFSYTQPETLRPICNFSRPSKPQRLNGLCAKHQRRLVFGYAWEHQPGNASSPSHSSISCGVSRSNWSCTWAIANSVFTPLYCIPDRRYTRRWHSIAQATPTRQPAGCGLPAQLVRFFTRLNTSKCRCFRSDTGAICGIGYIVTS